jgi:hypothetical protein
MSRTVYFDVHIDQLAIAGYVHVTAMTVSPAARNGSPMRQPVYAR